MEEGGAGGGDARAPRSPTARGSRLPNDWQLPELWQTWALRNTRLSRSQVAREAERFRDHWLAQPGQRGTKVDWFATWRNWCRKAEDDMARTQARAPTLRTVRWE